MSEEENKQPQIIMGGVSGNKELRVRRVHKKKADEMEADITPATENVETESVKKAKPSTSVSDASNEPKDEGKTEAVKAHKENKVVPSDSKPEIKPNEATATKDSAPQKGQDKIAPAAVNSEASFKVSEKKADANQESGTARKDEIKKPYPPKNIHTNAPSSTIIILKEDQTIIMIMQDKMVQRQEDQFSQIELRFLRLLSPCLHQL